MWLWSFQPCPEKENSHLELHHFLPSESNFSLTLGGDLTESKLDYLATACVKVASDENCEDLGGEVFKLMEESYIAPFLEFRVKTDVLRMKSFSVAPKHSMHHSLFVDSSRGNQDIVGLNVFNLH